MSVTVTDPSAAAAANTTGAATPPAAAAVPPAAAATPPAEPKVGDPDWLNGRIAKAKKSAETELLKSLGVENVDDAKAAIAAAKSKADADKSAETRAAELKAKLDGESAKTAQQAKVIAEHAGRQMVALTEKQKTAVIEAAGDDPAEQLRIISAMQKTWAAEAAATTTATDTAPGHTAPGGAGATSPPNQRAVYEETRKTNPFAAAEHGLRHEGEVYKPRQ